MMKDGVFWKTQNAIAGFELGLNWSVHSWTAEAESLFRGDPQRRLSVVGAGIYR